MTLLPVIKRLGIPLISMTGKPESSMAKLAQTHLQITVAQEACPLNLAPTPARRQRWQWAMHWLLP